MKRTRYLRKKSQQGARMARAVFEGRGKGRQGGRAYHGAIAQMLFHKRMEKPRAVQLDPAFDKRVGMVNRVVAALTGKGGA